MRGVLTLSLILIPFTAALVCWMRVDHHLQSRRVALGAMLWVLLGPLVMRFGATRWLTEVEPLGRVGCDLPWIPHLGSSVNLLVDELSAAMVMLTGLLGSIAIVRSWDRIGFSGRIFHTGVLCAVGGTVGTLLTTDLLLFFFFWELIPISLCCLIGSQKLEVDISFVRRFLIYSQIGSLSMLFSIIGSAVLHHHQAGIWTFSCAELTSGPATFAAECLLTLGFLSALAVKSPLVPLHGWLAGIDSHVPTDGSMDPVILLLKIPLYGALRLVTILHPLGLTYFSPVMIGLGIFTFIYGVLAASTQSTLKGSLIYSNISHAGLVLLAVPEGDSLVLRRVVRQLTAGSLSALGMFIVCTYLHRCVGTLDLEKLGAVRSRSRFVSQILIFLVAAAIGTPGTVNFIGELAVLVSIFRISPWIGSLVAFGQVLNAVNQLRVLRCVHRTIPGFSCPPTEPSRPDRLILLIIVLLITLLGIFPDLLWM